MRRLGLRRVAGPTHPSKVSCAVGKLLALWWEHCEDAYLTFGETKNGKARRIPISPTIAALLASQARVYPSVFTNPRTGELFHSVRHALERAVRRAGITTDDITLHTLRQRALQPDDCGRL
jgi:integrase